jgi:pilus assembly protein Flp/PilA
MAAVDGIAIRKTRLTCARTGRGYSATAGRAAFRGFRDDETAATSIEYGLMAALISLVIIGAVNATGQAIKDTLYGQIVNALASMSK